MKKYFICLTFAAGLAVTSCTSDEIVDQAGGTSPADKPISFVMNQKNITRATMLQTTGHYNFGVFGYKSTDKVNNVMSNYLVGYHDDTNAYSASGTTVGDTPGQEDGKSQWMYEGLGYAEFTGTYAYLYDHNDYSKMLGALNLDMVGGNQTRAYGPITLTLLPDSMP